MVQKWNWKTHEYEPYILPLGAVTFRYDMNDIVACAGCGKESKYGDYYTSLEIHNSMGLGYAVCEQCYNKEWKRRRSDNNMKKLFISCPMKGRTEENIRKSIEKMHKMAEIIFEQELEVIPTYTEHKPPENANQAIWYLGRAIQLMADADYFIGVDCSDCFKGCNIERNVAIEYGIKATGVNMREIMPDAAEIEKKYFRELHKTYREVDNA